MSSSVQRALPISLALGTLVAGFGIGRASLPGAAADLDAAPAMAAPAAAGPTGAAGSSGAGAGTMPDFRNVAKKVIPSVVTVRSQRTVSVNPRGFPFTGDPGTDEFFRRFFGGPQGDSRERRYTQHGLGSGVIVSSDGYILTNNHVVEGVDKVEVVAEGGKSYTAKILGADPQTDIAVLKVQASGIQPITMGDSDELEVGEWVLAVGNPFSEELGHTVTAGIVSAKGRSNLHLADYEDFIQTDAAINPGNSGGALVDTSGQLVGINAAIISQSGGYQGIGFAIPIKMARRVMDQLIKSGKVVRGWLGVNIQDLTPDVAEGMGIAGKDGAVVVEVTPDSPASTAGLKRGDVIVAVDGQRTGSNAEIRNRISSAAPGSKVMLTILRDGKEREIGVTLGELPGSAAPSGEGEKEAGEQSLGISVRALTPDLAARLGYQDDEGVVVGDVEPGGPADEAGLQRGDLIKEVNRRVVTSVAEYRQALGGAPAGKVVLFLVRRGERINYISIRP
jgi:serine protease Do